jgi:hypothetical protein
MSPLLLALAQGWRIAFLTCGAPAIGATLLLAIARLTGARWAPLDRLARTMPVVAIGAIGLVAALYATAPPTAWNGPPALAARSIVAFVALTLAAQRLCSGASEGFAGGTLALYAALVTPLAMDWLLGGDPAHTVSSAGMLLFVEQVGGACAAALVLGLGDAGFRRDMAKLLVAAALGVTYLAYMDYLIIWYGDLPARAGWYVARGTPGAVALVVAALAAGLCSPIAILALSRDERRFAAAGACGLLGLLLFNAWWVGGGWLALVVPVAVTLAATGLLRERSAAHG